MVSHLVDFDFVTKNKHILSKPNHLSHVKKYSFDSKEAHTQSSKTSRNECLSLNHRTKVKKTTN